ncbi:MAG: hypothetical protein ACLPV2_04505 [Steroidobacteraceae bacterium]
MNQLEAWIITIALVLLINAIPTAILRLALLLLALPLVGLALVFLLPPATASPRASCTRHAPPASAQARAHFLPELLSRLNAPLCQDDREY